MINEKLPRTKPQFSSQRRPEESRVASSRAPFLTPRGADPGDFHLFWRLIDPRLSISSKSETVKQSVSYE